MATDRRSLFKILGAGAAGLVAAKVASAGVPGENRAVPQDAVALLYDATRCIGCKACVTACSDANGLAPDIGPSEGMYQAPESLSSKTKNIIKFVGNRFHGAQSFMKQQCMHCVDPACVTACPLSALEKGEFGIVAWNGRTCLGCRCCQIACPYNIPKFEWSTLNPKIVKCEMCRHLLARGEEPGCTRACPRQAVIFGKRADLMADAKGRIAASPGKYYQDRVYGEKEGGGTQALYLSAADVSFSSLGLPDLPEKSIAAGVRGVSDNIYQHGVTPFVVFGGMIGVTNYFWGKHLKEVAHEAKEHGLKEQI
jgi:Fe-S-cluster-containing dehydrogenase component